MKGADLLADDLQDDDAELEVTGTEETATGTSHTDPVQY